MKTLQAHLTTSLCGLILLASQAPSQAAQLGLQDSPLFVSGFVDPNILFLIDNSGSMNNIVPDAPYDPTSTDITCPTDITLSTDGNTPKIEIRINASGTPFFNGGSDFDWGTDDSAGAIGATGKAVRCFDPTGSYMARLYGEGGNGNTKSPGSYLWAQYTGHYLNWYFGSRPNPDCTAYTVGILAGNWGTDARRHPCNQRRMDIAKAAAKDLVNSLSRVRLGLATYNGSSGARIEAGVDSVSSNRANLLSAIDRLTPSGATPLAESLQDIGRYFVGESGPSNNGGPNGQYDGNLTLHPESSPVELDDDTLFDHSPSYASGVSQESPIQAFCQQNFAVLLTDGRPQSDRNIPTELRDYDGDCDSSSDSFNGTACGNYDEKSDQGYESAGSDYLDDVAKALHEIDLRPDMNDFDGNPVTNNIVTYTIGFADDQVINDPLMQDTAENGGGLFLQAANAPALAAAFATATGDIFERQGSAAAVGATSGSVRTGSRIYQGRFDSGDWSGELLSIPINQDGSLASTEWDAAQKLTPAFVSGSRQILTYDPSASPKVGIPFRFSDLNSAQQAAMNTAADGTADTAGQEKGANRVDYIRGLQSDESPKGEGYRPRKHLLGDIMNSEPIYVGAPPFDYPDDLEGTNGQTYAAFKLAKASRKPVVYVGANDGMLHGFDASVNSDNTPTTTSGQEVIAYIPSKLIPKLSKLTDVDYSHQSYVDASPIVGDIYDSSSKSWSTLLAGALGHGGQGLYALDITDPSQFGESHPATVMWEFTDVDDADLGYVFGRPAIVRMAPKNNGKWAVVTGNGYNNSEPDSGPTGTSTASATGHAVLFVIDATDGTLIQKLDTGVGTVATPNALASPAPVDLDGDNIVDRIYAGDLYGNVWRFDVSDSNPSSWPSHISRLFSAVDGAGNAQPITTQVEVSRHASLDGLMIYFGTGKYLEPGDTNPVGAQTQTFYAIWDDPAATSIASRSDLHVQQILDEVDNPDDNNESLRITSTGTVDWSTERGWRMDLINTGEATPSNKGERVITNPVYLAPSRRFPTGRLLFTTLIPDPRTCGFGGTGWFMEIDPNDGSRLNHPPFDINRQGTADDSDVVTWKGDDATVVSGHRTKVGPGSGIPTQPKVLENAQGEYKYTSDTTGAVSVTREPAHRTGRTSWRELRP